ncbi:AAA family ATPase [Atlantibacter hermannii]|uniref:AAA family ATPase n=1 Tax=Atlantibacter hermannii TaxID=565 RepID=UPI00289C95FA|nr:AAA family ATPase [Atlantibacter hermannii]
MPVERLHVKSLKKFPEVNVHFNSRFNFITGPNGCGKTSLLAAIAHCLAWNGVYSRHQDDSEYWIDVSEKDIKYRFGLGPGGIGTKRYRNDQPNIWISPPEEKGRKTFQAHETKKHFGATPTCHWCTKKNKL